MFASSARTAPASSKTLVSFSRAKRLRLSLVRAPLLARAVSAEPPLRSTRFRPHSETLTCTAVSPRVEGTSPFAPAKHTSSFKPRRRPSIEASRWVVARTQAKPPGPRTRYALMTRWITSYHYRHSHASLHTNAHAHGPIEHHLGAALIDVRPLLVTSVSIG